MKNHTKENTKLTTKFRHVRAHMRTRSFIYPAREWFTILLVFTMLILVLGIVAIIVFKIPSREGVAEVLETRVVPEGADIELVDYYRKKEATYSALVAELVDLTTPTTSPENSIQNEKGVSASATASSEEDRHNELRPQSE